MSSATIVVGNAESQLVATADVIDRVRWAVAYRDVDLPPPPLQRAIRAVMDRKGRRHGYDFDVSFVYERLGAQLVDAGWPMERMTRRALEDALRIRGGWDGWTTLVDPRGSFGTGLLAHVRRQVELRCGLPCRVEDQRTYACARGPAGAEPDLLPYQREAAEAFLAAGRGVIDLPPRAGKTRIAAWLIHRLGLRTLYVTPQRGLVEQAVAAFRRYLPAEEVQPAVGGQANARRQRALNAALVWVATPQTAAGRKGKGALTGMHGIGSREFLVVDEFHHSAADTYQAVSRSAVSAAWRLGLTGTHFRADGRDLEMHSVVADSVYSRTVGDMVMLGRLVRSRVAMLRVPGDPPGGKGLDLYDSGVVQHEGRNLVLAEAARALAAQGRRVLVVAKEVEHTKRLAALIPGAVRVDGEAGEDVVGSALRSLAAGTVRVVVGTSVIGEGRDVPAADALVYACGGRSRVKVIQDTSRVLTAHPGKAYGIVVDAADDHHSRLTEDAAERLAIYRAEASTEARVLRLHDLVAWAVRP